jgi:hypothetical protein
MNPILMSLVVIVCAVGGAHLGMAVRKKLPEHHLNSDTKEVVKLGAGLIATLTALVLGLLVSSAKDTLDTMNRELTQDGAKVILLDRNLANYGPETNEIRIQLREHLTATLKLVWPEENVDNAALKKAEDSRGLESMQTRLRDLSPRSDAQRQLQAQALQLSSDLALSRWLIVETAQHEPPKPFLVVLLLWLTILYVCYGLISPRNGTVRVVYLISAISVAGAIFLILEMSTPLNGIIKVSSGPIHKAHSLLGS